MRREWSGLASVGGLKLAVTAQNQISVLQNKSLVKIPHVFESEKVLIQN